MNIVLEDSVTDEIRTKYILLTLDTFYFKNADATKTAYCLVDNLSFQNMLYSDRWLDLHNNLIKNYGQKNWRYCLDAIEHLEGKWQGAADSFYRNMKKRIMEFQDQDPGEAWSPLLERE